MKLKEKKIFSYILRDYSLSLFEAWYIEYYFLDSSGKKVKRQYRGDINKFVTVNDRLAEVRKIYNYIEKHGDVPPKRPGSRKTYQTGVNISIYKAVNEYLQLKKTRLRLSSYRSYVSVFRDFLEYVSKNQINQVKRFTRVEAEKYIYQLETKANTKNKALNVLKGFFTYIMNQEKALKENPFDKIENFNTEAIPAVAFNKEQMQRLKTAIAKDNPQLWLFCMMIYYAFIRPGELRQLKVENIWIEESKIEIPATIAKNKKRQFVQIPTPLKELIVDSNVMKASGKFYLFGSDGIPGPGMKGKNYFREKFNEYLRALGFSSRYKLYSWKHSGASACALAGIPIKEIQLQLRHSNLQTTDLYLKSIGILDSHNIKNRFPEL